MMAAWQSKTTMAAELTSRSVQQKRPFPFDDGMRKDSMRLPAVNPDDDGETSSEERDQIAHEMMPEAEMQPNEDREKLNDDSSIANDCVAGTFLQPPDVLDVSPYENRSNAEMNEPLFQHLNDYFLALKDCRKWTTQQLDDAKHRFRDISPDSYTLKPDIALFLAACDARGKSILWSLSFLLNR